VKLVAVSPGAAKQVVVSCQEHVGLALLCACQVESVKRAEPKLLKKRASLGRARSRDHDFVREGKQCGNIAPTLSIRIAADLDLKCGAAHPSCLSCTYETKNAFHRFGFVANAGLALIVRQAVQTTGIQIKSQSQSFLPTAERCAMRPTPF
jgi:hypothetical protein